jgi:N-acyl-L-homoserine lactone synthetase
MGWRVRPLGLPKECDGDKIVPLEVSIDEATLHDMRRRFRVDGPVLAADAEAVRWAA